MHHGPACFFVNVADDDATTCAFSRECCDVSGTAVKAICGALFEKI